MILKSGAMQTHKKKISIKEKPHQAFKKLDSLEGLVFFV